MKKTAQFMVFFLLIMCISLAPARAQSRGDVNSDGSINIIDALWVAQYYVGLNPSGFSLQAAYVNCDSTIDILDALIIAQYYVSILLELPECSEQETRTLTVEIDGYVIDRIVPSIDTPFINPPNQLVNVSSKYIYGADTSVNLYLDSLTPPPSPEPGNPQIQYQTAYFEDIDGSVSTNLNVFMDTDKTVKIVYSTHILNPPDETPEPGVTPYPTAAATAVGDAYFFTRGSYPVCVIEPEEVLSFYSEDTLPGYTGSGYVEFGESPSALTFNVMGSTTVYTEVRLRIWNPDTESWTFDGYTEPGMVKFINNKTLLRLNFSGTNYIVDRIVLFNEGTPESTWQDLRFGPQQVLSGVADVPLAEVTVK